ncbi:hypothetical protein B0T25DRAFT_523371 [Lasiosphaeria hispida]|uniref:Uncharacterized protein n=1 Tax=Lasiosphaeria hispida TaxID=260671 RepID=A0AAJ0M7L3_9PEZI|nr:hypothetical protein B0T25DRAFT_523371 [Lasiosphaeria hispida]
MDATRSTPRLSAAFNPPAMKLLLPVVGRDELASDFAPVEAIPVFNQRPAAIGLTTSFTIHFYLTYPLALTFIKLALLFQYLLIFSMGSRRRLFCKWLIGFTSV